MKKKLARALHIIIGIAVFIVIACLIPSSLFSREASLALATLSIMVYWWIARPVHIAVTALLPILINALFSVAPMETVLDDYFSPIVVLLIGAGVLIACWQSSGLDKRIALWALMLIGTSVRFQLFIWFLLSTLLSMLLPNAVVAATLCPIALAMVRFSSTKNVSSNKTLYLILLSIVWGAGIGGFGTPLGGAMNLVAIEHIEAYTGTEFMYITWTTRMLPFLVVLAAGTCVYLLLLKTDVRKLEGSRDYFRSEYQKIGKAKRSEIISLVLFITAVLLAFTRPLYASVLSGFKPFYAFLLMGIIAFFLPGDQNRLITWNIAVKKINWGLILLFSGGLAIGNLLVGTGAANAIASWVTTDVSTTLFGFCVIIITLGMLLSNVSSNTAATAILIPIVISIASTLNVDTIPVVFIAAAACNCAYILPTSIRAIPVGFGLDIGFMFKKGLAINAICLGLLVLAALFII